MTRGRRAVHQQPALERRRHDRRRVVRELEPRDEAGAADLDDRGPRDAPAEPEAGRKERRHARDVLEQPALERVEKRQRRAARQQVAAIRRAVIARRDRRAPLALTIAAPTGTPAPSALPSATRSGVRPIVGLCEERAGPAAIRSAPRRRSGARPCARQALVIARASAAEIGRTPPSP